MQKSVIIIAEAGVNHNGDINLAKELIDIAAKSGADFVKFQTFKANKIVSPNAKKAAYQIKNTIEQKDDSQFDMLKRLELSDEAHRELLQYADSQGIRFFSTAFDVDGLQYLNRLGFDRFKIPSGEITNYPYLQAVASFCKPVILSTGMANLSEIEAAIEILTSQGLPRESVTVLHCNTEYPTPMKDVNLKAMLTIQQAFKVPVGYSDHTVGIEVPIAAVALGATTIEKHFTIDRNLPGPDHRASLEPDELMAMVKAIRNIEKAIHGNGIKSATPSEIANKPIVRKSVFARKKIEAGQEIAEEDLMTLRPGDGINPMEWNKIVGRKAALEIPESKKLTWSDIL